MPTQDQLIKNLQESYRREVSGARTYRLLAKREPNEQRRQVLIRLAEAEDHHTEKLARRLKGLGSAPPEELEGIIVRIRRWFLVRTGTHSAVKRIEAMEDRDSATYQEQRTELADSPIDREMLQGIEKEEKAHSRVLLSMTTQPESAQTRLQAILRRERWHGSAGGWLGQAIYGVNDGLGAVFGIVSGVAGYTGGSNVVLISGLAGMLASALSMGSGAYLATKSEREAYEAELERE